MAVGDGVKRKARDNSEWRMATSEKSPRPPILLNSSFSPRFVRHGRAPAGHETSREPWQASRVLVERRNTAEDILKNHPDTLPFSRSRTGLEYCP